MSAKLGYGGVLCWDMGDCWYSLPKIYVLRKIFGNMNCFPMKFYIFGFGKKSLYIACAGVFL